MSSWAFVSAFFVLLLSKDPAKEADAFLLGLILGWLTLLVHVAVILFGVLFALDLLEVTLAEDITKILIAAGGIAFAVAFGVGGIDTAKQWWAKYLSPKDSGSGGI